MLKRIYSIVTLVSLIIPTILPALKESEALAIESVCKEVDKHQLSKVGAQIMDECSGVSDPRRILDLMKHATKKDVCVVNCPVQQATTLHFIVVHKEHPQEVLTIVNKMLELGADPNAQNFLKTTPLHSALLFQQPKKIIKKLLDGGASPEITNIFGDSALHLVAEHGTIDTLRLLLPSDIEMEQREEQYLSRAQENYLDLQNDMGETALHKAAARNTNLVRMLLKAGASSHLLDKKGRSPGDIARMHGHDEIIALLS